MDSLLNAHQILNIAEAKDLLGRKINAWANMQKPGERSVGSVRFEINIHPLDILSCLARQNHPQKFYWSNRDDSQETGGIGRADYITTSAGVNPKTIFEHMARYLNPAHPNLRYFGGFCFDSRNIDSQWREFGTSLFVLPLLELSRNQNRTTLACNLLTAYPSQISEALRQLEQLTETDYLSELHIQNTSINREDHPGKEQWLDMINAVSASLSSGQVQKVVLARKSEFEFPDPLDPFILLAHLKTATPNCFHFCFQPQGKSAFLGASPERLYKRSQRHLETEALAGTRPRGETEEEDAQFQKELLTSSKDFLEHQFVVQALENHLKELCNEHSSTPKIQLLQLTGGQHLISRFTGTLKHSIFDQHILAKLHPTPAVAGCPTASALKILAELEPFKRGWYAGPIGQVGLQESEFAVAIRSGLLQKNYLALYAGAGIIADSQAQSEWEEVENKMNSFLKFLTT